MNLDKIAKAIVGGLAAGAAALGTALSDGHVTGTEWGVVIAAVLGGLAAVWATPNAKEPTVGEG